MRYQKTHSDDIPELTRLWKQAFGDSDEDIARFFRDLFPAATGFAARDGEKIAAMCFALPQQLSCGDTVLSAAYLYAVATDEGYRGQGLCRALLAFAEKELKKRGTEAVLLVPADEGLAAMYERLGYHGPARIRKPSEAKEALGTAESVRPVEYAGLRETLLWDVPHVRYGKQLLEYEAGEAQLYALRPGAMPGCAAAVRQDDDPGGRAAARRAIPARAGAGVRHGDVPPAAGAVCHVQMADGAARRMGEYLSGL